MQSDAMFCMCPLSTVVPSCIIRQICERGIQVLHCKCTRWQHRSSLCCALTSLSFATDRHLLCGQAQQANNSSCHFQVQHAAVAGTMRQDPNVDDKSRNSTGAKASEEDDVAEAVNSEKVVGVGERRGTGEVVMRLDGPELWETMSQGRKG